MNRFTLFILGLFACAAASAQEAPFCQSMCTSAQSTCRAEARSRPNDESLMPPVTSSRNPLARTAESAVPGQGDRALTVAGATNRRIDRIDACHATYQRCTRSCAVPHDSVRRPGQAR